MENIIMEILGTLQYYMDAHKGFAELGEIQGNRVTIYCGGECVDCEPKCIEDAIKDKLPGIELIFR